VRLRQIFPPPPIRVGLLAELHPLVPVRLELEPALEELSKVGDWTLLSPDWARALEEWADEAGVLHCLSFSRPTPPYVWFENEDDEDDEAPNHGDTMTTDALLHATDALRQALIDLQADHGAPIHVFLHGGVLLVCDQDRVLEISVGPAESLHAWRLPYADGGAVLWSCSMDPVDPDPPASEAPPPLSRLHALTARVERLERQLEAPTPPTTETP
jgi:hypothetical protein